MYKIENIYLLLIIIIGAVQVFATDTINNNADNSGTEIINQETAGQLNQIKTHANKELQDKIDLYGSEPYGVTAFIWSKIQMYSIPVCFIGIAVGAIFQYVIGIRKLDLRDRGLKLVVAFITILVIFPSPNSAELKPIPNL